MMVEYLYRVKNMQINLKICSKCLVPRVIFKNDSGKLFCKSCWYWSASDTKLKPTTSRKRLPVRSSKRATQDQEYRKLNKIYLQEHPVCEAHLNGCSTASTEVHHTFSGKDRNTHFLETIHWLALCNSCHYLIHNVLSAKEARELGLKL